MLYHTPVLLHTCINALNIHPDGVYVDVTYGGGGHSAEILKLLKKGRLVVFDQDADAFKNKVENDKLLFIRNNFSNLKEALNENGIIEVNGILADLGVSSHQFNEASRGFSIRFDANLDMRMDTGSSLTASCILNKYEEKQLVNIFSNYGEVENSKRLAFTIVTNRKAKTIETVSDLKLVINRCIPPKKENQYLAQVFQALRIEVNNELESLKKMLIQSEDVLVKGGRLVVISYHSLEDRLVKNFMKKGKFEGELDKDIYGNVNAPFELINKKPIVPDEQEIVENNRARSAKLRIAQKTV